MRLCGAILLSFIALCQAQGGPSWRSCTFCETIISDANEFFGTHITSTSDEEFAAYFKVRCPQYTYISPIMEIICEEMVTQHPRAVFTGLRQQTDPQAICTTCQDC